VIARRRRLRPRTLPATPTQASCGRSRRRRALWSRRCEATLCACRSRFAPCRLTLAPRRPRCGWTNPSLAACRPTPDRARRPLLAPDVPPLAPARGLRAPKLTLPSPKLDHDHRSAPRADQQANRAHKKPGGAGSARRTPGWVRLAASEDGAGAAGRSRHARPNLAARPRCSSAPRPPDRYGPRRVGCQALPVRT
jgi:hypothetical protein